MTRTRLLVTVTCLALASGCTPAPEPLTDTATVVVSLLERPIGTETSTLSFDDTLTTLETRLALVERGGELAFESRHELDGKLETINFRAEGQTYRFVNVDISVSGGGGLTFRSRDGAMTMVDHPAPFFPAQGYAPLVGRALLVRYWEATGRPETVWLVPGSPERRARITFRGTDTVTAGGRDVELRRYTVDGVVWGRETVWLDERDRFAALTSRIHIMALEGVREDLVDTWPALQAADIRDRVADLATMASELEPVAGGEFAIVGARVIDGRGGVSLEDATILVRDGRIADVGPSAEIDVPAGVERIDAAGTTIVPGLWDMHAHASQIEWAPAYLAAGVTTARDMGGETNFLVAFRDAMADRRAVGPRLLLAGLVDADDDRALGAVGANTPDEGRAVVDRYKALAFDQIKLYSRLEADVARAIIDRAHEVGMTVTGHIPSSLGLAGAIEAGMDHIAHMPGSAVDMAADLAAGSVVIDPTSPWGELLGHPDDVPIGSFEPGIDVITEALAENYRSVSSDGDAQSFAERQAATLTRIGALHQAGVPIVAGTDGAVPGFSLLRNLELFVQAGLSPMEAIQSATIVPARAMGLADEVGTIEPGRRADLVVLEANPLDGISNIRRIRWVVSDGVAYDVAALRRQAGFRQ